ncbi:MAG: hypothetical protein WAX69_16435 [Victivallales bacterium]
MLKHRITFVGSWMALIIALVIFPGFETRGLAMGLIIGCWPFVLFGHSENMLNNPLIVYLVMFVLSGATVYLCAWFMDKAGLTTKIWVLLLLSIIAGASFYAIDDFDFEDWERSPAVSAAMESPELNYQPTRTEFNREIVIPKTISGGLLGLYMASGIGFLCSIAMELTKMFCRGKSKQIHPDDLALKEKQGPINMYTQLQKIILMTAAFGWGISFLGVLLPWSFAVTRLNGLGAGIIPNDPMLNYWLRMAGGGFTMIGVIFAAILVAPNKYAVLIPLMAYLSIAEGIILLVSGLRLGLPPFPFLGDASFCIGIGAGLLLIQPRVKKERKLDSEQ